MRMVLGTRPWAGKERLNSSRNVKSVTEPDFRVHGRQETDKVLNIVTIPQNRVIGNFVQAAVINGMISENRRRRRSFRLCNASCVLPLSFS